MKNAKRILASVLAAATALSLAACGKTGNVEGTADAVPEYAYKANVTPLTDDKENDLYPTGMEDDGFYSMVNVKVGTNVPEGETAEYEGQYDVYEPRLYFVGFDGAVTQLTDYASPDNPELNKDELKDFNSGASLSGIKRLDDGNLAVAEYVYYQWYEGEDGISRDDNKYWDGVRFDDGIFLRTLDPNGKELKCTRLDNEGGTIAMYQAAVTHEGNAVICNNTEIIIYNDTGKIEKRVPIDCIYILSALPMADGSLAVTYYTENGGKLTILASGTYEPSQEYTLSDSCNNITQGDGEYDFYYNDGISLLGYKLQTQTADKIFDWLSVDMNSGYISQIRADGQGGFKVISSKYVSDDIDDGNYVSYHKNELAQISKVPADTMPEKAVITLGTQTASSDLQDLILDFNRNHDDCRIEIADYSEYNTQDNSTAGTDKMLTEFMSGDMPDIIALNSLPYKRLAAKGLLEDLYPYMDNDGEFSREDFFPSVLKAMEVNGKLYSTVSCFDMDVYIGSSKVVGEDMGWTYDRADEVLANMPEGCTILSKYMSREAMLQNLLALNLDSFVDWTTGQCNFDQESFIKLLEYAASFTPQANINQEDIDWTADAPETLIPQGLQVLSNATVYSFDDLFYSTYLFNDEFTFIGLPTADGSAGNVMKVPEGYAMSAKSEHKDLAWEFLRTMFTEKYQSDSKLYMLPTNINVYNAKLNKAMTTVYQKNENGDYILDENGEKIPKAKATIFLADGQEIDYYCISKETGDKLWDLINNGTKRSGEDDSIYGIVYDEAQAFFNGDKSAQEVAKLIQSKANIYVNEQR